MLRLVSPDLEFTSKLELAASTLVSFLCLYFIFFAYRSSDMTAGIVAVSSLLILNAELWRVVEKSKRVSRVFALSLLWLVMLLSDSSHMSLFSLLIFVSFFILPRTDAVILSVSALLISGFHSIFYSTDHFGFAKLLVLLLPPLLTLLFTYCVVSVFFQLYAEILRSRKTDGVTGCGNRTALQEEMSKVVNQKKRHGVAVTALALRIPDMPIRFAQAGEKKANVLLTEIVNVWQSRIRNTDTLCRYNDEVFVCLLPGTDRINSSTLASDLLKACQVYDLDGGGSVHMECKFVEFDGEGSWESWLSELVFPGERLA